MRIALRISKIILILVFALISQKIATADTLGVINTNDSGPGSLRAVVDAAENGDEIIFNIPSAPPYTIALTSGQITIDRTISIIGPGPDELIIDGSANGRIFQVFSSEENLDVSISGITLTNGSASSGGAIRNDESLEITNLHIIGNNSPSGSGGGGVFNNGISLTVTNSTIMNNTSNFGGGILNRSGGTLILEFTSVSGNFSIVNPTSTGGGIHNGGEAFISDSMISGNMASASGGGITNQGAMSIARSTISGNGVNTAGGGGIDNRSTQGVVITNTTISGNNSGLGSGGGVRNTRGTIDITNSTIAFNMSPSASAGGISNNGGTIPSIINLKNSLVVGNTASVEPNCTDTGANSDMNNIANNISDDSMDACDDFFDPAFDAMTMLGPLQDNGGSVLTHELLGPPNPALNAIPDGQCTDQGMPPMDITQDSRTFPRPGDFGLALCDIGAFELQDLLTFTVNKNTVPPGTKNFEFFGNNDTIAPGCPLSNAVLDDGDSITCLLPLTLFEILENPTPGFNSTANCASILAQIVPVPGPEIGRVIIPQAGFGAEIIACNFTNTGLPLLSILNVGQGSGSVTSNPPGIDCGADCDEGYDPGTVVTLTATPDADSIAGVWGGACAGYSGGQAMVRVDQVRDCTVSFDLNLFDLNINLSGTGTGNVSAPGIDCGDQGVDCTESYTAGTVVNLIATPDEVSSFTGFTGDPDCADGMITMDEDIACTANFNFLPLLLNPISPGLASNINTISAEQTSSNSNVAFVWGFMPGTTIIGGPTCNGTVINIKNPRLLSIVIAGAEQIANYTFFIPLIGDFELPILTQAVDIPTCRKSEAVTNIIRKK